MDQTKLLFITGDLEIIASEIPSEYIHLSEPKSEREIIENLRYATHYIVGGPEYLSDRLLDHAPKLRHIVVLGTGTNSFVDEAAAESRGITVSNTPAINAEVVAEFALGMTIAALSNAFYSYTCFLEGKWYQKPRKSLREAKISIVGMGNIGTQLAAKLSKLTTGKVRYNSRVPKPSIETELGIEPCSLEQVLSNSDVAIFAVNYNETSHHLVNARSLNNANDNIILINLSNPKIFEPHSLRGFLVNSRAKAFFDGYYNEWVNNLGAHHDDYRLMSLGPDKFVATTHIAAQERQTNSDMLKRALQIISEINI